MNRNPILDTDSYKLSHYKAYPDEVSNVYSYAESRGGHYPETLFFGLQPYLTELLTNPVTDWDVEEAARFAAGHGLPFNEEGWMHIVDRHDGALPLKIKAVAEGTLVPTHNVLVTVENTDPAVPWLTNYVETAMLRQVWYGTTVATRIFNMKRRIKAAFERTSDNLNGLPFALLDFSSRGCSSYQANEIGGAAYLAHFLGSDSIPAVRFVNANYRSQMSGFSVPATEHSIMCAWGEKREEESFKAMIDRFGGPGKIVSVVSDTWDIYRAAGYWAKLAPYIQNSGTTLVVRPDSGDVDDVIPELIRTLGAGFGSTTNSKGCEVLNGVKILWGDGINEETYMAPFEVAQCMFVSADSIMTGSGGGLMQANIDRDTCKFAFKASAILRRGATEWEGISKDPITDTGKRSKKGRLKLIRPSMGTTMLTVEERLFPGEPNLLRTVYNTGEQPVMDSIDEIRSRIDAQL